jgi:anti-sigma factor RsiW
MRPYYALTPERRCDQFELRVRFDRRRPPAWVRRIEGEPVRVFEVLRPGGVTVPVDAAGEAHQSFQSLALHVGYGMQWLAEP